MQRTLTITVDADIDRSLYEQGGNARQRSGPKGSSTIIVVRVGAIENDIGGTKERIVTTTAAATGRRIEINGANLYIQERGQGQAIVLVQPGLLSSEVYEAVASRLAERFRVITFDSRGHGQSTNPRGALSFEVLADDTGALIRTLDLEQPFVGGWSDGGEVALHVALRYPGLARGLIAGGTSLEMGGSERARSETRAFFHANAHNVVDIDAFATAHAASLLPYLRQVHPNGEAQWQNVVRWSAHMWLTYGGLSRAEAARIAVPTLVVCGDHDEFHPVEAGVRLYRWLPNAELAILPGSDHMRPVFEPACLTPILIDFIDRH